MYVSRLLMMMITMPSSYKPITFRSRYQIANDILHIVNDNPINKRRRHKTSIGHAAGLTHWQTVRYLRGLIHQGLASLKKQDEAMKMGADKFYATFEPES